MKTNLKLTPVLLIFFIFLFTCRTTPENDFINNETVSAKENIPSEKLVPVKIGNIEVEYENNKGTYLANNNLNSYTRDLDPFTFTKVNNLIDTPENNEQLASLGLSTYRKKGKDLPINAVVTILVYETVIEHIPGSNANIHYDFKRRIDFKMSEPKTTYHFFPGLYDFIIFSTGTDEIPKIENMKDVNKVKILLEKSNSNVKFFHENQSIHLENDSTAPKTLDINLRRSTGISIILDFSEFGIPGKYFKSKISSVKNVKLTYNRPKKLELRFGEFCDKEDGFEEINLPINNSRFLGGDSEHEDKQRYLIEFEDAIMAYLKQEFIFSADVGIITEFGPEVNMKNLHLEVKKINKKHIITLKPMICGAYMGPHITDFRRMMCSNLGEGYSGPVSDAKGLELFTYIWGRKTKEGEYDEKSAIWKTTEDPCPTGYRIPTKEVWEAILRYNPTTEIAPNDNGRWFPYHTWKIGDRLFLPVYDIDGYLLWTSSPASENSAYGVCVKCEGKSLQIVEVGKIYNHAVRCMKS